MTTTDTTDATDLPEELLERHRRIAGEVVSEEAYGHLIGGEWVTGDGESAPARDATTGERLATVRRGTAREVDRAVAAAEDALDGAWGNKSPRQRSDLLREVAERLDGRDTEIARLDTLEVGKPNMHSLFVDTTVLVETLRYFAALSRTADDGRRPPTDADKHVYTRREPYGVVGCIGAWNFPAMFVAWKLGPALAAGNAVVYKPSSRASLSTLEVARTFDAVLPPGAVNVVTGSGSEVGDALTRHPDVRKVSLTGGQAAGQKAMENAAPRAAPVSLELGGKSPVIVFPDADLESAVESVLVGIFFNQGQQCTAGSRLFCHESIAEEFLERLVERTGELSVGDPLAPTTDIGPMVDADHARSVEGYVEEALAGGATARYRGDVPEDLVAAPYVPPTILTDVGDDDAVVREEVFGPVLSVMEWSDREEVLRRANDTEYGLAAGVFTDDVETAHETAAEIEAGTVWVNTYNDLFEPAPHGGVKASGIGRELSEEALDDYRETKTVTLSLGESPTL